VEQDAFLSAYIHDNWKVGDTVETSGPQGTFFYEPLRDAKKVIAIAGGSGITPIYAMANAIADGDEDFEMTILYGSRTKKDILFQKEFDAIMARTYKVKLVNVLSEAKAKDCEHGFITAELIQKYAGDGVYSIFAAGSQGMYKFLDGEAEKLGIAKKYYRKELYDNIGQPWNYPGYPMEAKDQVFNLKIKMCDKVFDIPCSANENILVALERAGVAGPNRCRGGICGWCRSRLLSGDVFIPEDTDGRRAQDKLDGYIHPCASFAVSDLSIEMPLKK
jgi:NAD(P)H-flavin reductase